MAESRRYGLSNQLDIKQILVEAQHRWLRPAEICEILQNYKSFRIAPEPGVMPPSGSLFLFDRKVLRYFRKDGHNWRKKKDGKTVKEAHERLKAGSIDVLHCYYAHGEENENFQRRSYWMLEEDLSHIVLVHYREVQGSRTNFNRIKEAMPRSQETEEIVTSSQMDGSVSSNFHPNSYPVPSQTTDMSLNSAQASEYEDAESVYDHQASSRLHSFLELQQPVLEKIDTGPSDPYHLLTFSNEYRGSSNISGMEFVSHTETDKNKDSNEGGLTYESQKQIGFPSWEDVLENCAATMDPLPFQPSFSSTQSGAIRIVPKGQEMLGQLHSNCFQKQQDFGSHLQLQENWQNSEGGSSNLLRGPEDQKLLSDSCDPTFRIKVPEDNHVELFNLLDSGNTYPYRQNDHTSQNYTQIEISDTEHQYVSESEVGNNLTVEGKSIFSSALKQQLLDGSLAEEGLKKLDSFNRWMSRELGDVNETHLQSSSEGYWDAVETEDRVDDSSILPQVHLETYMMGPSLSQDQLYSIIDFSPNWAYVGLEIKVLITGRFLTSKSREENLKWSCMFGEVEVPAEEIADGVLRCHTPLLKAGRVPFYVTCSNRQACSEVREFEYRINNIPGVDIVDNYSSTTTENLHMRFGKLLCLSSVASINADPSKTSEMSQLSSKITPLLNEDSDDLDQLLRPCSNEEFSLENVKEQLLQKLLKEKLHTWLLQKAAAGGKGPSVLDEGGQGVLHFAAALGYDWALLPTILAGVNVNFRDVNGWNALHWAAFCGRERTVASLISLGAAPGALIDPTPKYPSGRTPADLASANGHKGIAGYLAEAALSAHLSSLNLDTKNDVAEISGARAVQTVSEKSPTLGGYGDVPYGLSLKDSLAAVCNAAQAAARIHQVFRVQSFQKKQMKEYGDDKFGMSDERALSLLAVKAHKTAQHDEPVTAAAIRIQNKFRSWKGRKEFLIFRQRIVKIQAHVRGHQVRKNYGKIIWSVGILEKVILRWRRKGSGLRGFKLETVSEGSSMQDTSSKEDEFDFLKEGRRQTEERLQKALARVKSMVQYPEARDQYRRLLNVVTDIQGTKVCDKALNNAEEIADIDDELLDLEALLDDDTFMRTAC